MIGLAGLILILAGCEETRTVYVVGPDIQAPTAPRGVTSTTGDGQVWVDWFANGESDLAGYKVWRASEANGIAGGPYAHIATVNAGTTTFIDQNVANGITYFYAVSAFDNVGNESALSPEDVYDTPRPEGSSFVQDFFEHPGTAGFAFTNSAPYGSVVAWNSGSADIYMEYVPTDGAWFINVTNVNTDIQDMGYTNSFDDISYSPTDGWSAVGWTEAIVGHTYVIWTADDHYAKVRITATGNPTTSGVSFDWGYQIDDAGLGQLELKPAVIKKPQHDPATYLRRQIAR
jgi:hypothetical protein